MVYQRVSKPYSGNSQIHKKDSASTAPKIPVQAKSDSASPQEQEMPSYTPLPANWATNNNLMRSLSGNQVVQRQEESGAEEMEPIQAKLTIGEVGDKYEQEADQTAQQVVNQINAPAPQQSTPGQSLQREEMPEEEELQMKPASGTIQREEMPQEEELQMKPASGTIQREEMPQEEEELQMKPEIQRKSDGGGMAATPDLEASIQQAKGGGQPLANNIREPMEKAFGADFSGVNVHTDAHSDQLNQSIQAKAFTTGQDVFFRQGAYDPGSRGGQELIAHELTHVVQQTGSNSEPQRKEVSVNTDLALERKADVLGSKVPSRKAVQISGSVVEDMLIQPFKADAQKTQKKTDRNDLIKKGAEFEKNLGLYAYNHPKANAAAAAGLNKMRKAILGQATGQGEEAAEYKTKLAQTFGVDKKEYSGAVGKDVDDVLAVFTEGNLRERMTAFYNAGLGTFKKMVVDLMEASQWEEAQKKGLDQNALKKRKQVIKKYQKPLKAVFEPDLFEQSANFLEHKRRTKTAMFKGAKIHPLGTGSRKSKLGGGTSERKTKDLKNNQYSAEISDREKKFLYGADRVNQDLSEEKLPWEEGGSKWQVKDKNKFIKEAQKTLKMPAVAGPSGTADRLLDIWKYLNVGISAVDFRLALLGWMITGNDHSFHEIMAVSKDKGLPYTPGVEGYKDTAPLNEEELRQNACLDREYPGLFPDEVVYHEKLDTGKFNLYNPYKSINEKTKYGEQIENAYAANGQHMDEKTYKAGAYEQLLKPATAYTTLAYSIQNLVSKGGSLVKPKLKYLMNEARKHQILINFLKNPNPTDHEVEIANNLLSKIKKFSVRNMICVIALKPDITIDEIITEAKEHNKHTVNALKLLPLYEGKVYRGEASVGVGNPYKENQIITINKFLSTSQDSDRTRKYAEQSANKKPLAREIVLEINCKTGRSIDAVSTNSNGKKGDLTEVILLPGTQLKVESSIKSFDNHYRVNLSEVAAADDKANQNQLANLANIDEGSDLSNLLTASETSSDKSTADSQPEVDTSFNYANNKSSDSQSPSGYANNKSSDNQSPSGYANNKSSGNPLQPGADNLANLAPPAGNKASKDSKEKIIRYNKRADDLKSRHNYIGAGVQYTRLYALNPTVESAHAAAIAFKLGGDSERAVSWYRKVLQHHPTHELEAEAQEYLQSKRLTENAKYKLTKDLDHRYVNVKVKGLKPEDRHAPNVAKTSGLGREEVSSNEAAHIFTTIYIPPLFAAEQRLQDAQTTQEQQKEAQESIDFYLLQIERMNTGLDTKALIDEYKSFCNGEISDTPLLDQLKGLKVKYLNTSEEREDYKLKYDGGMIKQGNSTEGYRTDDLSTNFLGAGHAIFSMSADGDIYAAGHKVSQFHHSSFLAGMETAAAGEIKVTNGKLDAISNKSGHYRPSAAHLIQALDEFSVPLKQQLSAVDLYFFTPDNKDIEWPEKADSFYKKYHEQPNVFSDKATIEWAFPELFADKKTNQTSTSASDKAPTVENQQTGSAYAPTFMLNSVVGAQGMGISQELLNAIRKDIVASGSTSKWADNHETQAIAEALNIQIKIHDGDSAQVWGNLGQLHHLKYNGRDHYGAYMSDIGGEETIDGQNYKFVKVSGDGDCFYNALLKSMSSFGNVGMTVSDLRNLVNTKLTDQDIADVAIPLIEDYQSMKPGLGANFIALMQTGRPHFKKLQ